MKTKRKELEAQIEDMKQTLTALIETNLELYLDNKKLKRQLKAQR